MLGPYNNASYVQYRIPKGNQEAINFNKPLLTQAFVVEWEKHVVNLKGQWSEDVDDEKKGAMEHLAGEWVKEFMLSSTKIIRQN